MKKCLLSLVVTFALVFALFTGTTMANNTVTLVLIEEPHGLEPNDCSLSAIGQVIMKNVVETLTEISTKDGSITPRLATSWKQIDPYTWHFTLRQGVKFHDGEDFNADSAIYGIKRMCDRIIAGRSSLKFFSEITMTTKALDSHLLEIKTSKPEPILSTLMGVMPLVSPKTPMGQRVRNPIGTGPYKFAAWNAGQQIIFERFPGYWGKKPEVEKAIYVFRSESRIRAAMVAVGEADLAPSIAKQDANRPDMDVSYLNAETPHLRFDALQPPMNDRRVRMALNLAIDRNSMRGSIFSKDVIPATQIILPNINGYNPNIEVWPYDPKKAKQLIDEARKDGVPVDTELLLLGRIAQYPGINELLESVLTWYRAIGLNVKLKQVEGGIAATYASPPFPAGAPVIYHANTDNYFGDAVFSVFYKYACKGRQSASCDPARDEVIEKAQAATGAERTKLWQQAFKLVNDFIADAPLFHMVSFARVGKRINYKPNEATAGELQLADITFKK